MRPVSEVPVQLLNAAKRRAFMFGITDDFFFCDIKLIWCFEPSQPLGIMGCMYEQQIKLKLDRP